jgi:hypothetical protein
VKNGHRVSGLVQPFLYGLPQNRKKLTDSLAVGDAPAVDHPASVVGSSMSRANMESASLAQQPLPSAAKEPELRRSGIAGIEASAPSRFGMQKVVAAQKKPAQTAP